MSSSPRFLSRMLFAQFLAISASPDSNADEVCPDEFGHGSTELSAFYFTLFYSMFAIVYWSGFTISSIVLIFSYDWNIFLFDFEFKFSYVDLLRLKTKQSGILSSYYHLSCKIDSDLSQDYNSCFLLKNLYLHVIYLKN